MNALGYVFAAAGAWLALSCVIALPIGRAMKRADDTQRATYPPPVPAPRAADDAAWLDAWPTEVDEDALINAEFVSMISAAWHWSPEDAA